MPTSKKTDVVPRHRACVLDGASPPSFVSYFAYQTFLQTQRARRMTSSIRAAGKAGRRRGTRARDGQARYSLKKRRHSALPEMSRLQLEAPTSTSIAPVFSPSSSCSSSSTSSPTSATWQLSPLSDVGAAFELPSTTPSEAETESSSPTSTTKPMGSAGAKKKYPCSLCDKSFDYKHVLQNHNRTHTGEKPYQCPQCHKRFTRDHHLKTHIRLHTGEKPFGCAVCHKRFVQVANLRRHERVHAGERLHRCGTGHCDATSDCDRPTTPVDGQPFECAARGAQHRRKRHRDKSGPDIGPSALRPDDSAMASTFSTSSSLASGMPASATVSCISSTEGLEPSFDRQVQAMVKGHGAKSPFGEANDCSRDGCLTMDVGFRVIRNNRYHQRQLGRRYEAWPHLHRLSQPCQEQPEDLSVKK